MAHVPAAVAAFAPEVARGYAELRAFLAADGALPATTKRLLIAAAAIARGRPGLAREELAAARAAGLAGSDVHAAAAALLLARGEALCGEFLEAAGAPA